MKNKGKKTTAAPASSSTSKSSSKAGKASSSSSRRPLPPNLLLNGNNEQKGETAAGGSGHRHSRRFSLKLEPLRKDCKDVYVARKFLSSTECKAWIDFVESGEQVEFVSHPATRIMAHRECSRWQRNDGSSWNYASKLFDRLVTTGILDEFQANANITRGGAGGGGGNSNSNRSYRPVACNGNLRLYKYEKGMSFGRHIDECNDTQRGQTEVTMLIYLSDCQGGATRFHMPHNNSGIMQATTTTTAGGRTNIRQQAKSASTSSFAFVPETGSVLLHVHGDRCLEHEADPVLSGVKYVLRTDLVYALVDDDNQQSNKR